MTLRAILAALMAVLVFITGPPDITPARVAEDSPSWDCRYDGNQICGPGNRQGLPAGNYSSP